MIDWFKTWSKEIIIVVIIVTLVEIILPNNNTKKYVKIASGLIIMYTVMYPIFNNFIDNNNTKFFLGNCYPKTMQCFAKDYNNVSYSSGNAINSIYKNNIKKDIGSRLMDMGYECGTINISINEESYDIENLQIEIKSKNVSKKKAYSIVKTIEHVYVSISRESESDDSIIDEENRMEIVNFLSETYGVCKDYIEVK